MSGRRFWASVVLTLAVAGSALAGQAQAASRPKAVSLVGSGPFMPVLSEAATGVRVPIAVARGVPFHNLRVVLLEAQAPGARGSLPRNAFSAALVKASKYAGPAILVTLKSPATRQPGDYSVLLEVRAKRSKVRTARLPIVIRVAAAQLRAPATFVVERTVGVLGIGDKTNGKPLAVRETSGRSRVTDLTVTQLDRVNTDDRDDSGQLTFHTKRSTIRPGGLVQVPYRLRGRFPLGDTTGVLEVDAPELEKFQPVAYQVSTRRARWVIVLVLILGLLVGHFTRVLLQRRMDLSDAQVHAIDVRDRMARALRRAADPELHAQLPRVLEELDQTIRREDDPTKLKVAADAAAKALDEQVAALDTRRRGAEQALTELRTLLATDWSLPEDAQADVDDARRRVDDVSGAAGRGDVAAVEALARDVKTRLPDRLVASAQSFGEDAKTLVDALDPASGKAESKLDRTVNDAAARARENLRALPRRGTRDLEAILKALDGAVRSMRSLCTRLSLVAHQMVDRALTPLRLSDDLERATAGSDEAARSAPQSGTEAVQQALVEFDRAGANEMRRADGGFQRVRDTLESLLDALSATVREHSLVPGQPGAPHRVVEQQLEQGNFEQAAVAASHERVASLPRRSQEVSTADLVAQYTPGDADVALVSATAAAVTPPPTPPPEPVAIRIAQPAGEAPIPRERVLRAGRRASNVQTLLLAGVLVFIGYVAYSDAFVGHARELLGIFLWAFALNITVGSVLPSVPKKAGDPPTTTATG